MNHSPFNIGVDQEAADRFAAVDDITRRVPDYDWEPLHRIDRMVKQETKERAEDIQAVHDALKKFYADLEAFALEMEPRIQKLEDDEAVRKHDEGMGTNAAMDCRWSSILFLF